MLLDPPLVNPINLIWIGLELGREFSPVPIVLLRKPLIVAPNVFNCPALLAELFAEFTELLTELDMLSISAKLTGRAAAIAASSVVFPILMPMAQSLLLPPPTCPRPLGVFNGPPIRTAVRVRGEAMDPLLVLAVAVAVAPAKALPLFIKSLATANALEYRARVFGVRTCVL